ncbi:uncharacterized protein TRIVIDRAFT_158592 [Trichoderma virens Gv29-8]|uniref:Archaemetzincin-2 n=1 Tax=Hypocrea virens (strain Gv29-8 / FGSC 10586) TaxID=413071 RepID=G9N4K2_HYPVG|nr:uncharacterized protein TRIVIDRAFT_158592 [Trichoderma virens Gv29-8]EHK18527.1 hypothetical protein TRIVIDRAFT_158592 [Trichoderma virens Gv29-8]
MATNTEQVCEHSNLYLNVSPHASKAGFKRATERQRILAATKDGRFRKNLNLLTPKELFEDEMTFPGPLVLPDDDLAEDPECPPQDFREWRDEEERNPVTRERKTIYIIPSPTIMPEVSKMTKWSECRRQNATQEKEQDATREFNTQQQLEAIADHPKGQDILEYLSAFFHGMDVKPFEKPFRWQKWDKYAGGILKSPNTERRIGLLAPNNELFGIRCRLSPDGVSPMQVNLDDILDALAENIPPDAHSVMMLLHMDMYEGDGDVFTAGRAYGGSRIAAVSLFRDNPLCAPHDDGHAWPSSHCAAYIDQLCLEASSPPSKQTGRQPSSRPRQDSGGPLHVAIEAAAVNAKRKIPLEASSVQWLERTVVTMAHELCHCLGLDHCTYFACAMQGCANLDEAQRQPPYLCPVCLEKLCTAIGEGTRNGFVRERYEALRRVCERWGDASVSRMFAGYKAWLDAVIERSPGGDVMVIEN